MNISVVLCTYNGEKYIAEQLDSILGQDVLPDELVVVDDCSSDATLKILSEYQQRSPFDINIHPNHERQGVVKSFNAAISFAQSDYIALCDQDDCWSEGKLSSQLALIQGVENVHGKQMPVLCYSDLDLVDANMVSLNRTFFTDSHLAPFKAPASKTLAVQNVAAGCGMFFNRSLADVALPIGGHAVMHDWWLALVASLCGELVFAEEITVSYRQHSSNSVGSSDNYAALFSRMAKPSKVLEDHRENFLRSKAQFLEVAQRMDAISVTLPDYLERYRDELIRGFPANLKSLLMGRVIRQGPVRTLSYISGSLLSFRS